MEIRKYRKYGLVAVHFSYRWCIGISRKMRMLQIEVSLRRADTLLYKQQSYHFLVQDKTLRGEFKIKIQTTHFSLILYNISLTDLLILHHACKFTYIWMVILFSYKTPLVIRSLSRSCNVTKSNFLEKRRKQQQKNGKSSEVLESQSVAVSANG